MKISVISDNGDGLALATHLSSEGHAVSLAVKEDCFIGEGIVNRDVYSNSNDLDILLNDASSDITLFDKDSFGDYADTMRKQGRKVLGASKWSQTLEENSEYKQNLINAIGWDTQEVDNGINLYIVCWFNGIRFISTYVGLMYKRMMSGGLGADIGFSGMLANFYQPTFKVNQTFLIPLSKVLRRTNHRGCFIIHANVKGEKYSVKNISASFMHPLSFLLYENTNLSKANILLRLMDERSKDISALDQWSAGILVSLPPYPTVQSKRFINLSGIDTYNLKHLWLSDVCKEGAHWKNTGYTSKIGYVTARGVSTNEAVKRLYRTLRNIKVRDLQYRDDVGRWHKTCSMLDRLSSSGWIKWEKTSIEKERSY